MFFDPSTLYLVNPNQLRATAFNQLAHLLTLRRSPPSDLPPCTRSWPRMPILRGRRRVWVVGVLTGLAVWVLAGKPALWGTYHAENEPVLTTNTSPLDEPSDLAVQDAYSHLSPELQHLLRSTDGGALVPKDSKTALVEAYLQNDIPPGLSKSMLDHMYELAGQADQADNLAREAYANAIDAKALLFISAATDAKDVIERYWQTHFLHYNASVQSAAADRIRHFMQNTTISSPLTFRKTPLCLASIYEGKNDAFPEYARVLVDSVSRNKGYANLHLFVHNVSRGSIPHDLQRSNVKIVDIRQIHPSYAYRGFAGLITDRLCKHFKNLEPTDVSFGWEGIDQDCAQLERRLDAFEGQGGAAIDQLRGLWSVIFEAWVGPELCQSWGWIDAGTAIGDLRRWMDNDEIRNADLVTAHEGDQSRLYLRSAFTVHNYLASQSKGSTYWKRCKDLASLANLSAAFANPSDWQSLTEGCYSYGALTSPNVRTVLAPWQLPSWTDTRLLLLNDGRANYCVGESNAEVCRGWVRGFMEEQVIKKKKQLLETTDPDAAAAFRPYKTAQAIFSGPPRKTISTPLLAQDKIKCSDWIPREYNLCLDESSFAERRSRGEQAYLQEVHTDPSQSRTSAIVKEYDVPSDGVGIEGMNGGKAVGETLIVPFLRWATKPSTNEKAPAKKGQPVQVEQTWFYSVDKGSIQITPGKILLHTINGWW